MEVKAEKIYQSVPLTNEQDRALKKIWELLSEVYPNFRYGAIVAAVAEPNNDMALGVQCAIANITSNPQAIDLLQHAANRFKDGDGLPEPRGIN